jgi:hypothetical protein
MSAMNLDDDDDFLDDEEELDDMERRYRGSGKRTTQNRRKIEYLLERKRLREMLSDDESYWDD